MTDQRALGRVSMVAALRYRDFRYFWTATALESAGKWMEAVVLGWLVLKMTGSPLMVGIAAASRWLGYALGPVFGMMADRYDRRKLLIAVAALGVVYSATLAFLAATGTVRYWHILVIGLVAGMGHAFDIPLRFALAGDLVDKRDLTNAVALSTVALDVTAMLGPAVAGPLINVIDIAGVCWLLTFNYALNVLALYVLRPPPAVERKAGRPTWGDLINGARYIRGNHPVVALLLMAIVFNLLHFPLRYALLPVLADSVLGVGAPGYGFLLAVAGAGALVGAAVVAGLGSSRHEARLCIIASVAVGILAGAFCLSSRYGLSLVLIGFVGLAEGIAMTTMPALLLALTPVEMRGRVMGVRSLAILPLSLGNLVSGAMAGQFGAPVAGVVNASLHALLIAIIAVAVPSLRKSE
ncbi:MAG: MFS transporter [Chloroflexota bacterium]